jgi:flavorubredoxin
VIGEGLEAGGVQAVMCPMSRTHRTTVVAELLDASGILVGSPNLNSTIFPTVADALTYAKGMKPPTHKLKGAAFGSYGWSPASIPAVEEFLQSMKVELVDASLKTKYVPSGDAMEDAFSFGQAFAEKIKVEA